MKISIYFNQHRIEQGGGIIQTLRTYEAIKALDYSVRLVLKEGIITTDDIDMTADIHHFISANPNYIPLMRRIRKEKKGIIALSTIYWWTPAVQRVITPEPYKYYRYIIPRYFRKIFKQLNPASEVYKLTDIFLPNSPREGALIRKYFPISSEQLVYPVPNAADPIPADHSKAGYYTELPEKYILCSGSFNTRKNQLRLVRALKDTLLPVVFMGAPGLRGKEDNCSDYYHLCKAEASENMQFIGHIEHQTPKWYEIFSRAAVFAMPSACETPSLAALEAGLFGSAIAITAIGSTYEYFGNHAEYCNPSDIRSIRKSVEYAWNRSKSENISKHIASRFLWSHAAKITTLAYHAALTRTSEDIALYQKAIKGLWYDIHKLIIR